MIIDPSGIDWSNRVSQMKHAILIISLILCLFTLSACNTIQGMGRDIEKAGEAIQGGAQKAKS